MKRINKFITNMLPVWLVLITFCMGMEAKCQKATDSLLTSSSIGLVINGGFDQTATKSTIVFTHINNFPTRVVIKMENAEDSATIVTSTLNHTYNASDGTYYYYDAVLQNTKEKVTFAVKYNLDGKTFNSFGIIREEQQTIVVFFVDSNTPL
jgi:pyocin large subunit-like protein